MAMGRPKAALVSDTELREQLESLANSRSVPAGLVPRAKIVVRFWEDQFGGRGSTGDQRCHGRPVASTLSGARAVRTV